MRLEFDCLEGHADVFEEERSGERGIVCCEEDKMRSVSIVNNRRVIHRCKPRALKPTATSPSTTDGR